MYYTPEQTITEKYKVVKYAIPAIVTTHKRVVTMVRMTVVNITGILIPDSCLYPKRGGQHHRKKVVSITRTGGQDGSEYTITFEHDLQITVFVKGLTVIPINNGFFIGLTNDQIQVTVVVQISVGCGVGHACFIQPPFCGFIYKSQVP